MSELGQNELGQMSEIGPSAGTDPYHGRPVTKPIPATDSYYDLGTYRRTFTTDNADAQAWCNRGLIWCYGFHHEEAIKCFEQVVAHDEKCLAGYWGIAYALGANYNKVSYVM